HTHSVPNRVLNRYPMSATATLLGARTSCTSSVGPHMATTWMTGYWPSRNSGPRHIQPSLELTRSQHSPDLHATLRCCLALRRRTSCDHRHVSSVVSIVEPRVERT